MERAPRNDTHCAKDHQIRTKTRTARKGTKTNPPTDQKEKEKYGGCALERSGAQEKKKNSRPRGHMTKNLDRPGLKPETRGSGSVMTRVLIGLTRSEH